MTVHALSSAELIDLWDRASVVTPLMRASLILSAACSAPVAQVEAWSIGKRDSLLLACRALLFGSLLPVQSTCPQCSERMETSLQMNDIRLSAVEDATELFQWNQGSLQVDFRVPTAVDLQIAIRADDPEAALLSQCLTAARQDGEAVAINRLSPETIDQVVTRMSDLDAQADIELAFQCFSCGTTWTALLDVVSYFWSELSAYAARLLRDVHQLARAYCWSEADILKLSPTRRAYYLEMVASE